jgi:hypothetical protein
VPKRTGLCAALLLLHAASRLENESFVQVPAGDFVLHLLQHAQRYAAGAHAYLPLRVLCVPFAFPLCRHLWASFHMSFVFIFP